MPSVADFESWIVVELILGEAHYSRHVAIWIYGNYRYGPDLYLLIEEFSWRRPDSELAFLITLSASLKIWLIRMVSYLSKDYCLVPESA
jgi:hypothetical protein